MIHHYTSVAALEAILRSGRLRFTRLDLFDDVIEAQTIAGIDFGAKFFASCWVKQDVEDIVQWSMYGNSMRGVRSEEHTSELQSLMRISYAVFCLKKNN